MLLTPAEQQEQLFQLLNCMPSAEHESFLGHWLYPLIELIEVHHTYITLGYFLPVYTRQAHRDGMPRTRLWYRRWVRRRASERSPACCSRWTWTR